MAKGDLSRQMSEAATLGKTGAGHAEVIVDDLDLLAPPSQRDGALQQMVLPLG